MPTNIPTVSGTPTYVLVTFRYIDANGVKDSFSIRTTLARATDTVIQGAVTALAAASNANFYAVNIQNVYEGGTTGIALAVEEPREDARDVIETLCKDPASGKTQYEYIPAPLDSIFVPGTNNVDTTNTLYENVGNALDLLLPAAYNPISVRFAQHKLTAEKTEL